MTADLPASTGSSTVVVLNESGVDCDLIALSDLVRFLLPRLRLHPECQLGITLVDERRMTELHVEWMDEPGPTDVLSFPIDELVSAAPGEEPEAGILGDIVLCPAFLGPQAQSRGRTLDEELCFLVIHGVLHLIGHDHATPEEYEVMFALQDELLAEWNQR